MRLFQKALRLRHRASGRSHEAHASTAPLSLRSCHFEVMEPRRLLAADVLLGAVYFEEASGDDTEPDVIEVTFEGGAAGTQLTELRISGDKLGDGGVTIGDVFFDTANGGLGAFESVGLTIEGHDGFEVTGVTIADGGTDVILHFDGFDAGEKLIFSVDVDEASFVDAQGNVDATSVTEGGEFQRSTMVGTFQAEHFEDLNVSATFWDAYDANFAAAETAAGSTLDLPADRYDDVDDLSDRTAGAVGYAPQKIIPATISGYVYHDRNNDGIRDAGEEGIENVRIEVFAISTVDGSTGTFEATTGADGFWQVTGLAAGEYRVVEATQPSPFLDGKDTPGTIAGVTVGTAVSPDADRLVDITLGGGDDGIEYNFGEVLPSSISGLVHASTDGDCIIDENDILLEGVQIDLLDEQGSVIATTYTDADGRYLFEGLGPGVYQVFEHQPAAYYDGDEHVGSVGGQITANDEISGIELISATKAEEYNFCEHVGVDISGHVYHDHSNDGVFDASETGIGGVTVQLLDAQGNQVATTTTSSDPTKLGYYEFTDLAAGTYTIVEVQPSGWLDGLDTAGNRGGAAQNPGDKISGAVLEFGKSGENYNFGELLPSTISGLVHASTDGDCIVDENDILLEGVQIDLLNEQGSVIATTYTNADGQYQFEGLAPGVYTVFEHQPSDYYDGDEHVGSAGGQISANDKISAITLVSGTDAVEYNFCEHVGVDISGHVYHDHSNDGVFDASETGIGGVTVRLLDAQGSEVATTTTSSDPTKLGYYEFTDLAAGTYTIVEVQPAGWLDGLDTAGNRGGTAQNPGDRISGAVLEFGKSGENYNFGELLPSTISGLVHASTDGDCIVDEGDILLEGVQIDLLNEQGSVIATTYTNADGQYQFEGLAPGVYQVFEHQPSDYYDGDEHVGSAGGQISANDKISAITLVSGTDAVEYNFCEHVGVDISGHVYHDHSNDGVFDSSEKGIGGVTVRLLDAQGNQVATTTTSSDPTKLGYYEFTDLAAGTYTIVEVQPSGWLDGLDTAGNRGGTAQNPGDRISGAVLEFGKSGQDYDFGELLPSTISGLVHASTDGDCIVDEGDILLEGVQIDLLNEQGSVIATTFTNADGRYQFEGLAPGVYTVFEHQPSDYYDGDEHVGSAGGQISANDKISAITLVSGTDAVEYNFCENVGVDISGHVYHDRDNDGVRESGEEGIGGVTLQLLDAQGNQVATTTTSNALSTLGFYEFTDLDAGIYTIVEVQPSGWLDGLDTAGNRGGTAQNPGDRISGAVLEFGKSGQDYDFGELLLGSIRGQVIADRDGDCILDPDEEVIEDVVIELLDAQGQVIATTTTNASGQYQFVGLRPGVYSVREQQPDGFFNGDQMIGSGGGVDLGVDHVGSIEVGSGDHLVNYNFCELPPAALSGFVFVDGAPIATPDGVVPSTVATLRTGTRTPDDTPLAGVVLELRHGVTGEALMDTDALPGTYASGPIRTVTDANGYYEFTGLAPGTYAVFQVHPDSYIDGVDTAGTTGGVAINPADAVNPLVLSQLLHDPAADAIVRIPLGAAETSIENNFSEVLITTLPPPEDPPVVPPVPLPPPELAPPPPAPIAGPVFRAPLPPVVQPLDPPRDIYGGVSLVDGYTWHLSVVDAGLPRSVDAANLIVQLTGTNFDVAAWRGHDLDRSEWMLRTSDDEEGRVVIFGTPEGLPVVGDFNGDGTSEVGVFIKGEWFIDVNGNGKWDEGDLWAKLGTGDDLPVTGDWDGDGKDDIGIFGPAWPGDPRAVAEEPGLPDPYNQRTDKKKNLPPERHEAALGARTMKLTSNGKLRADLIDHVFHYGSAGDVPIAGDWNGDGISTIGVFRSGQWHLDLDGDGRFTERDVAFAMGGSGDRPVVGDFDGDGVDEVGVFRDGHWHIDANGDRELDARDRVFELGQAGDVPVVGDWDGDGADDPGIYHPHISQQARAQR